MHNTLVHDEIEKRNLSTKAKVPPFNKKRTGNADTATSKQAFQFSVNEVETMESQDEDYVEYLRFCDETDLRSNMTRVMYEEGIEVHGNDSETLLSMHARINEKEEIDGEAGGLLEFSIESNEGTKSLESLLNQDTQGECTRSIEPNCKAVDSNVVSDLSVEVTYSDVMAGNVIEAEAQCLDTPVVDRITILRAKLDMLREQKAISIAKLETYKKMSVTKVTNNKISPVSSTISCSQIKSSRMKYVDFEGMDIEQFAIECEKAWVSERLPEPPDSGTRNL